MVLTVPEIINLYNYSRNELLLIIIYYVIVFIRRVKTKSYYNRNIYF